MRLASNSPWQTTDHWQLTPEANLDHYHVKTDVLADIEPVA